MVSNDCHPDKHACIYDNTHQRHNGRLFLRQLQLWRYDSLDTLVGDADDVPCAGSQQDMVYDLSAAVIWGMAPAIENFRRKQQAPRIKPQVAPTVEEYVGDEFPLPGYYVLQRILHRQAFGHLLPVRRNYRSRHSPLADF